MCGSFQKKTKRRAKMNRQFKKEDIKTAVNTQKMLNIIGHKGNEN